MPSALVTCRAVQKGLWSIHLVFPNARTMRRRRPTCHYPPRLNRLEPTVRNQGFEAKTVLVISVPTLPGRAYIHFLCCEKVRRGPLYTVIAPGLVIPTSSKSTQPFLLLRAHMPICGLEASSTLEPPNLNSKHPEKLRSTLLCTYVSTSGKHSLFSSCDLLTTEYPPEVEQ